MNPTNRTSLQSQYQGMVSGNINPNPQVIEAVQIEGIPVANIPTCISVEDFEAKFQNALKIYTEEENISGETSISSCQIGDCITVFGINKDENRQIISIFGCHFSCTSKENADESDEGKLEKSHDKDSCSIDEDADESDDCDFAEPIDIETHLEQTPQSPTCSAEIYIIGGDECEESTHLLDSIRNTIKELQSRYSITILGEFINLNEGTHCNYIDVNLQMDGTLTFCRYYA